MVGKGIWGLTFTDEEGMRVVCDLEMVVFS